MGKGSKKNSDKGKGICKKSTKAKNKKKRKEHEKVKKKLKRKVNRVMNSAILKRLLLQSLCKLKNVPESPHSSSSSDTDSSYEGNMDSPDTSVCSMQLDDENMSLSEVGGTIKPTSSSSSPSVQPTTSACRSVESSAEGRQIIMHDPQSSIPTPQPIYIFGACQPETWQPAGGAGHL